MDKATLISAVDFEIETIRHDESIQSTNSWIIASAIAVVFWTILTTVKTEYLNFKNFGACLLYTSLAAATFIRLFAAVQHILNKETIQKSRILAFTDYLFEELRISFVVFLASEFLLFAISIYFFNYTDIETYIAVTAFSVQIILSIGALFLSYYKIELPNLKAPEVKTNDINKVFLEKAKIYVLVFRLFLKYGDFIISAIMLFPILYFYKIASSSINETDVFLKYSALCFALNYLLQKYPDSLVRHPYLNYFISIRRQIQTDDLSIEKANESFRLMQTGVSANEVLAKRFKEFSEQLSQIQKELLSLYEDYGSGNIKRDVYLKKIEQHKKNLTDSSAKLYVKKMIFKVFGHDIDPRFDAAIEEIQNNIETAEKLEKSST